MACMSLSMKCAVAASECPRDRTRTGRGSCRPPLLFANLSPRPAIVDELPTRSADLTTTRALTSILRPSLLPLAEPAARKVARKATVAKATVAKASVPKKAVLSAAVTGLVAQTLPALAVVRARSPVTPTPTERFQLRTARDPCRHPRSRRMGNRSPRIAKKSSLEKIGSPLPYPPPFPPAG